jgi:hypothetical protein
MSPLPDTKKAVISDATIVEQLRSEISVLNSVLDEARARDMLVQVTMTDKAGTPSFHLDAAYKQLAKPLIITHL